MQWLPKCRILGILISNDFAQHDAPKFALHIQLIQRMYKYKIILNNISGTKNNVLVKSLKPVCVTIFNIKDTAFGANNVLMCFLDISF
jgi:hypothetical protein